MEMEEKVTMGMAGGAVNTMISKISMTEDNNNQQIRNLSK
jgi:hypothetical protein